MLSRKSGYFSSTKTAPFEVSDWHFSDPTNPDSNSRPRDIVKRHLATHKLSLAWLHPVKLSDDYPVKSVTGKANSHMISTRGRRYPSWPSWLRAFFSAKRKRAQISQSSVEITLFLLLLALTASVWGNSVQLEILLLMFNMRKIQKVHVILKSSK